MSEKDSAAFVMSRRDLLRKTVWGVGLLAAAQGCENSNDPVTVVNNPVNPTPTPTVSPTPIPTPTPDPTITPTPTPTPPPPPAPPAVVFAQPVVRRSENGLLSVPFDFKYATNVVGTPNGPRNFRSRTINGTLAPPTIRLRPGDHLEIPVKNMLPPNPDAEPLDENTPHHFNTVNNHTHGLHISPSQDNVLLQINPGQTFVYKYDIPTDHPPGTYWYHPHKHGATAMHLFSGMAGSIIIEGGLDDVPQIAAAADVIFNINELVLGGLSQEPGIVLDPYEVPDYTSPRPFATSDRIFVVNGEFQPRMQVRPGQVVRLRILNASARSTAPLTVQGSDWNIISFDGLALPEMLTVPEFTIAPANRADVLVRFDNPGTYEVELNPFTPGGGGAQPGQVLAFIDVAGEPFPQNFPSGPLPVSPTLPNINGGEGTEYRTLAYGVGNAGGPAIGATTAPNFTINGVRFSSSTINQIIPLGSVIEWTLDSDSPAIHPHHIHIHPFQVIATSDGMLNGLVITPPNNPDPAAPIQFYFPRAVWLDTVAIPPQGWVRLRQRFPDFPGLFVLHCHILVHEDIGMMQLVNVV